MSQNDEIKNVNEPVSPEERDAWIANLSDSDEQNCGGSSYCKRQ
jgi:hypothetical protein